MPLGFRKPLILCIQSFDQMKGTLCSLSQSAVSCSPDGKLNYKEDSVSWWQAEFLTGIKGTVTWNAGSKDKYDEYVLYFFFFLCWDEWSALSSPDFRHNPKCCYYVWTAHSKNNKLKMKGTGRSLCHYVICCLWLAFLKDSADGVLWTESRRFVGAILIVTAFFGSVLLFILCLRKGIQIIYFSASQLLPICSVNSSLQGGNEIIQVCLRSFILKQLYFLLHCFSLSGWNTNTSAE